MYKRIEEKKIKIMLEDKNIPNKIKVRTKNIYGIYKRLSEGQKLPDIYDLLALKIMVHSRTNALQRGITRNVIFGNNQEFVNQIKSKLFSDKVYVYTTKGDIIELPKGSTPIDFAYKIRTDISNTMVGAFVNGEYIPIDYTLKNKERATIVTDELSYRLREEWIDKAHTALAKRKIREFNKK